MALATPSWPPCGLADELAQAAGLGKWFQRFSGGVKAHYIGHGVALELNEPFDLHQEPRPLATDMTLALELQLGHPAWTFIKLEDIMHLTTDGARLLTREGCALNVVG